MAALAPGTLRVLSVFVPRTGGRCLVVWEDVWIGWIFFENPCKTWFLWVDLGIKDRQTFRIFRIFVRAKK